MSDIIRDYIKEIEKSIDSVDWSIFKGEGPKKNQLSNIVCSITGFKKDDLETILLVNSFYDHYFDKMK
jgi:hypothetical protein